MSPASNERNSKPARLTFPGFSRCLCPHRLGTAAQIARIRPWQMRDLEERQQVPSATVKQLGVKAMILLRPFSLGLFTVSEVGYSTPLERSQVSAHVLSCANLSEVAGSTTNHRVRHTLTPIQVRGPDRAITGLWETQEVSR